MSKRGGMINTSNPKAIRQTVVSRRWQEIYPYVVFLFLAFLGFIAQNYIYGAGLNWPPIRSDGHGYYMYLPAFFIYKDPKMLFINELQDVGSFATTYFQSSTGAMVDKYTMGTALLQMPTFLISHLITSIVNPDQATGFSVYYQLGNRISACIWYFIGASFAYKTSKRYVSSKHALIATIICTIGTNLFHYYSYDASFSHVYSFALISIFIFWLGQEHKNVGNYFVGGIIYGLIVLTRVTDATVIILYLFYRRNKTESIKTHLLSAVKPNRLMPLVSGAIISFSPQIIYWYTMTGRLFLNSYGETDPGFIYWNNPKIIDVLFLPERGIFFWCPIVLISIILAVINRKTFHDNYLSTTLVFLAVYIYVISSWHAYGLSGGFGHRIIVNVMSLIVVFTAVGLQWLSGQRNSIKIVFSALMRISVIWTVMCMYAYWRYAIPMDKYKLEHIIKMVQWYLHI